MVDQQRPRSHQHVARGEHGQIRLRGLPAVRDRLEEGRIEPPYARQVLRVHPVVLAVILVEPPQLARIRHQHLVPELRQHPAGPRRMRPGFQHHPRRRPSSEPLLQPGYRGANPAGLDTRPRRVHPVELAVPIAQIHTNR